MKKIGIMFGMENTFPPALVEKINGMKVEGVTAEFVKLGGVKMADPAAIASSSIASRRTFLFIAPT